MKGRLQNYAYASPRVCEFMNEKEAKCWWQVQGRYEDRP
jgi:hypothetical protein